MRTGSSLSRASSKENVIYGALLGTSYIIGAPLIFIGLILCVFLISAPVGVFILGIGGLPLFLVHRWRLKKDLTREKHNESIHVKRKEASKREQALVNLQEEQGEKPWFE